MEGTRCLGIELYRYNVSESTYSYVSYICGDKECLYFWIYDSNHVFIQLSNVMSVWSL